MNIYEQAEKEATYFAKKSKENQDKLNEKQKEIAKTLFDYLGSHELTVQCDYNQSVIDIVVELSDKNPNQWTKGIVRVFWSSGAPHNIGYLKALGLREERDEWVYVEKAHELIPLIKSDIKNLILKSL